MRQRSHDGQGACAGRCRPGHSETLAIIEYIAALSNYVIWPGPRGAALARAAVAGCTPATALRVAPMNLSALPGCVCMRAVEGDLRIEFLWGQLKAWYGGPFCWE